jgi:hypothetical protein
VLVAVLATRDLPASAGVAVTADSRGAPIA